MASRVFLEGGCAHDIDGGVRPMDITRALRAFRDEYFFPEDDEYRSMTAVADRIEAAHDKALIEMRDRAIDQAREEMEMDGWVQLPKDADGEYIHVGDLIVNPDISNRKQKVAAITPESVYWWDEDGCNWRYSHLVRHYHAPTVEDVLHSFICDVEEGMRIEDDIIAEYAAKLRLAGDAE